tara:strand:- start:1066 stop:2046 length:981 start_codon:yes stop_codon:yes gene_type:complete
MPANVENMFSAREIPWHRIGEVTEGALSSKEAIVKAGLDWTVSTRPIATFETPDVPARIDNLIPVPDFWATVRDTDDSVLGVVGNRYTPIQNLECFDFLDTVIDDSSAKYETAGSLYGGKVVWMMINLGKDVVVGEDKTVPYLLMTNSHDGSTAIKGVTTPIRVVCSNTLQLALKNSKTGFSFRHTNNVHQKIDQARKLLDISYKYVDNFQEEVEKMIETHVERDKYFEILDATFPQIEVNEDNTNQLQVQRAEFARQKITQLFEFTEYDEQRYSAWAVINAMSNFEQWFAPIRKYERNEVIAMRTIKGTQSPMTDKAYSMLKELA